MGNACVKPKDQVVKSKKGGRWDNIVFVLGGPGIGKQ